MSYSQASLIIGNTFVAISFIPDEFMIKLTLWILALIWLINSFFQSKYEILDKQLDRKINSMEIKIAVVEALSDITEGRKRWEEKRKKKQ